MRVAFLFLALALFIMSACSVWTPTFMPSGYDHHGGDAYNAPPGPEAKDIGYEYTPQMNETILALWRDVAKDLVSKMESTGLTPRPVYVEGPPAANAFNTGLDYGLREELRARGYTLAAVPDSNLHLRYEAWREGDEKIVTRAVYNGDEDIYTPAYDPEKPAQFIISLTMLHQGQPFGSVKTRRTLPAYGYVTGEGARQTPDRLTEGFLNELR